MKKIYILQIVVALVFLFASINKASAQDSLAIWTFDKWMGGSTGIPEGQSLNEPIFADRGLQAKTAKIGNENMFPDGEGGTVRPWGTPSSAGYVRSANMIAGTYYRIIGITTVGYKVIKVTCGYASDSSTRYYYMQMQYRKSSNLSWKSVGDPAFVNVVSEKNIPTKFFSNVQLPAECENIPTLEIRFLVTALATGATTTQSRVDSVFITATKSTSGLSGISNDQVKVFSSDGKLFVNGAAGSDVNIYNIVGTKVRELQNVNNNEEIILPGGQIYIVKVRRGVFKVAL